MLREVTRQLYAKTAEQGDTNAELAESRAGLELSSARTQLELDSMEQRLRTVRVGALGGMRPMPIDGSL